MLRWRRWAARFARTFALARATGSRATGFGAGVGTGIGIGIGIGALVGACVAACGNPPRAITPPASAAEIGADVVMENVTVHHSRDGATTFVARAPLLQLSERSDRLVATDAGIWLPRRGLSLGAASVDARIGEGRIEGRGGVWLTARDGLEAEGASVLFERGPGHGSGRGAAGTASSDAGLRVRRGGVQLSAKGFALDLADERVELVGVESTFAPRTK